MTNKLQNLPFGTNTSYEDSHIYLLSQLRPAGTKLLLDPRKSDVGDLVKLTLFDLVLKQVLLVKKAFRKAHPRDKYAREYIVVETGKNFNSYQPIPFESYFTDIIDEDSYYQLRSFIRSLAEDLPRKAYYKRNIIKDLHIKDLFRANYLLPDLDWLRTSKKGKMVREDIETFMQDVDENIAQMVEKEPKKAMELIRLLGGNIFLLENLQFEVLKELKNIPMERSASRPDGEWAWIDLITELDVSVFDVFDELSDLFEDIDDYFDFSDFSDGWDGDFDVGFD
ncbi:MAG: hypothetical protein AAFP76_01385 [Bacteroidota bacterium]